MVSALSLLLLVTPIFAQYSNGITFDQLSAMQGISFRDFCCGVGELFDAQLNSLNSFNNMACLPFYERVGSFQPSNSGSCDEAQNILDHPYTFKSNAASSIALLKKGACLLQLRMYASNADILNPGPCVTPDQLFNTCSQKCNVINNYGAPLPAIGSAGGYVHLPPPNDALWNYLQTNFFSQGQCPTSLQCLREFTCDGGDTTSGQCTRIACNIYWLYSISAEVIRRGGWPSGVTDGCRAQWTALTLMFPAFDDTGLIQTCKNNLASANGNSFLESLGMTQFVNMYCPQLSTGQPMSSGSWMSCYYCELVKAHCNGDYASCNTCPTVCTWLTLMQQANLFGDSVTELQAQVKAVPAVEEEDDEDEEEEEVLRGGVDLETKAPSDCVQCDGMVPQFTGC